MTSLKIRLFEDGKTEPNTTITVPGTALRFASKLIPKKAITALQNEGIDLDEIVRLSTNPEISGTLVEIEEHKENTRVVISLE